MANLGELLRELRKRHGMTQERLAQRAQVTARTLRSWETNQQQPRQMELESVLTALKATPQEKGQVLQGLSETRSGRLIQTAGLRADVPLALLGDLPGIGDLLCALRRRRGWTQEQLAEAMGVTRSTVARWEATRVLPSDEDIERLCRLLLAAPEEQAALQSKRLIATEPAYISLEEHRAHLQTLIHARTDNLELLPLLDLHFLALKRQLRLRLGETPEVLRLLAETESLHGWWHYTQGRAAEANALSWRALNLARGRLPSEQFWVNALNLLASQAMVGGKWSHGPAIIYPWLRLIAPEFHLCMLCDLALHTAMMQKPDEAQAFLQKAERSLRDYPATPVREAYFRVTTGRVLANTGKPVEAMSWLPSVDKKGTNRIHALIVRADTYINAGEKDAAARSLDQAALMLKSFSLPSYQRLVESTGRRL